MSGAVRGTEELVLDVGLSDLRPAFRALGQGVCPNLLRFFVRKPDMAEYAELAATLRSGHCRSWQELGLIDTEEVSSANLRVVFQALQEGSCPNLTKIDLDTIWIFQDETKALANLLRSCACPQLKSLLLSEMDLREREIIGCLFDSFCGQVD